MFVVVYLDNILVFSNTEAEHKEHIKKVLEAMTKEGMKLNLDKSEFHKKEVDFLRFVISENGIKMDQGKLKAVRDWPVPQTIKETQSFLGFANFYRKFI